MSNAKVLIMLFLTQSVLMKCVRAIPALEINCCFKPEIVWNQLGLLSRLLTMDLTFIFHFSLYFIFSFLFIEQLGLGFICHAVTSVTSWWHSHKTDYRIWENRIEGSGIKWCHTTWTTHVGLMSYTWSFRVGCTVVSMDHE